MKTIFNKIEELRDLLVEDSMMAATGIHLELWELLDEKLPRGSKTAIKNLLRSEEDESIEDEEWDELLDVVLEKVTNNYTESKFLDRIVDNARSQVSNFR